MFQVYHSHLYSFRNVQRRKKKKFSAGHVRQKSKLGFGNAMTGICQQDEYKSIEHFNND